MIQQLVPLPTVRPAPTVWGLTPAQLHDRFWAARGVQVVRCGEPSESVGHARQYLLIEPDVLATFPLRNLFRPLSWLRPECLLLRLGEDREATYRERVITGEGGRFVRFQRSYGRGGQRTARVALTRDSRLARIWQSLLPGAAPWGRFRRHVARRRAVRCVSGHIYDRRSQLELAQFVRDLVVTWKRPDATIARARAVTNDVWADPAAEVPRAGRFAGPVWIGAGRKVEDPETIMGPAVLWDDPDARPVVELLNWSRVESAECAACIEDTRRLPWRYRAGKRAFDIVFAILALLFTLPIFPVVMLAIWIEDGRPFFFSHRRETLDGQSFPCLKFRSMRKDAEETKSQLSAGNRADGPQFFIEDDPRLTRIGRFIRKYNIDELPQFLNVLAGHMSVVGPRPSPYSENQYCPSWREARLSVRPGITGLWQVKRTRCPGLDFQEWIRYDIEYVERQSFRLDMWIIWRTLRILLRPVLP